MNHKNFRKSLSFMLPSVGYMPAGMVWPIGRQHEGYAYLRP